MRAEKLLRCAFSLTMRARKWAFVSFRPRDSSRFFIPNCCRSLDMLSVGKLGEVYQIVWERKCGLAG